MREEGSVLLGDDGKRLPIHERYSARFFPLDVVFRGVDLDGANSIEVPWYHQVDNWLGYASYIGSENMYEMKRPDWLEYHEWNPIGWDSEND